jgi:hypothetical protein
MTSPLIVLAMIALAQIAQTGVARSDKADFVLSEVKLNGEEHLQMLDINGDGALDFVRVGSNGLSVHLMRPTGAYPEEPDATVEWNAPRIGWQVADIDSDNKSELLLLTNAQTLTVHRLIDGSFAEGVVLLENSKAALPRGVHRISFAQDIDEDGLADIVIPGPDGYRIYRMSSRDKLDAPIQLACQVDVDQRFGNPSRVDGRFQQSVRIPWFKLRDINGDGMQDLVAESSDVVQFYLAQPGFLSEATWKIPLGPQEAGTMADAFGIDFDNLLGTLDDGLTWRVENLDGVAPHDIVLHADGVFRIFLNGSEGDINRTPDQLLKVSGNVMHYLLRDVAGDERPELQVIRGPKITMGQVLRRLVIPGVLDFDIYSYDNSDGTFSKSPSRRSRLRLEIPGLLSFAADVRDESQHGSSAPAKRLRLTATGEPTGIVDFVDDDTESPRLSVYANAVPDDLPPSIEDRIVSTRPDDLLETFLLRDMDTMQDGSTRTISLETLVAIDFSSGDALRAATVGEQPIFQADLDCLELTSLRVLDLDGNGLSDITLTGKTSDSNHSAWLFVARP